MCMEVVAHVRFVLSQKQVTLARCPSKQAEHEFI